jgi:hypothetical protein
MNKSKIVRYSILGAALVLLCAATPEGCQPSSDDIQRQQQESILQEGTRQTGMPAIKNFRERKMLKTILEMRDQNGLVTYTYLENMVPTIIKGHTACGGKLSFIGNTIGYGIPYSTEYTNPQKLIGQGAVIAQADPNGLFSPASAEGTWILMQNPNDKNDVEPVYIEPRIFTSPFPLPMD